MSHIKFSRLISVSSEDTKHPANNLLKSDSPGCGKWKCQAGEKQAVVILQLEKACVIDSITVGNENSAFIEILVGKSAVPDVYEVFRVASVLMTAADSRNDKNKNTVRFFRQEEFESSAAKQSWDRIKIICSQTFSRNAQYGLSFIKVYSKSIDEDKSEDSALGKFSFKKDEYNLDDKKENLFLGKFALKKEEANKDSLAVGSFFARRSDPSDNMSAASSIRAATNNLNGHISSSTKRLSDVVKDFQNAKRPRPNDDEPPVSPSINGGRKATTGRLLYFEDDSDDEKSAETESTPTRKKPAMKKDSPASIQQSKNDRSPKTPNSRSQNSQNDKFSTPLQTVKKKPFNHLLEGVVIVLSGFQNPYRSDLRSRALQMGAKYKADWDSTCTHLICAFTNTPKLQTVKGQGWIVKKDWIEDCYKLRKRLLASDYKLIKTDSYTNSNDEEIWEGEENTKSNGVDASVEFKKREEVKAEHNGCTSITLDEPSTSKTVDVMTIDDIYDADTDIDSDRSQHCDDSNRETVSLEVLPEFFENIKFYLGTDLLSCVVDMLKRYIIAYKGDVLEDIDEANYIISGDTKYVENLTNTPVILPDWIWECNDQQIFIPAHHYALS